MKKSILRQAGFTLIELLVVIAIIGILATIVIAATQNTRAKASDTRSKEELAHLVNVAQNEIPSNGGDFTTVFSAPGPVKDSIDAVVAREGLVLGTNITPVSGDRTTYQVATSDTEFAIVVPLRAEPATYWCIDSTGQSRKVNGFVDTSNGPKSCSNIVPPLIIPIAGDESGPPISLNGEPYTLSWTKTCGGPTIPYSYTEPGWIIINNPSYTVLGVAEGPIVITDPSYLANNPSGPVEHGGYKTYDVTTSSGSVVVTRWFKLDAVVMGGNCNPYTP